MQRIDLAWLIETFQSIDALVDIQPGEDGIDSWSKIHDARSKIEAIFMQSVYAQHLNICRRKADEFIAASNPAFDHLSEDFAYAISAVEAYNIREAASRFKLVFLSELSALPAFLVTPKENYSIDYLIDAGYGLFPADMLKKAPETEDDSQEAGRCLAFERNTACGFHTYRVVEAVLRRYWDVATNGKPRPKIESLGKMSAELVDGGYGDKKVTESLLQLARLHRNPLAHPDVILTSDEAISALGMARSVITHMLTVLPDVPPTTGG